MGCAYDERFTSKVAGTHFCEKDLRPGPPASQRAIPQLWQKQRKGMASAMPITAGPEARTGLPKARVKAQP